MSRLITARNKLRKPPPPPPLSSTTSSAAAAAKAKAGETQQGQGKKQPALQSSSSAESSSAASTPTSPISNLVAESTSESTTEGSEGTTTTAVAVGTENRHSSTTHLTVKTLNGVPVRPGSALGLLGPPTRNAGAGGDGKVEKKDVDRINKAIRVRILSAFSRVFSLTPRRLKKDGGRNRKKQQQQQEVILKGDTTTTGTVLGKTTTSRVRFVRLVLPKKYRVKNSQGNRGGNENENGNASGGISPEEKRRKDKGKGKSVDDRRDSKLDLEELLTVVEQHNPHLANLTNGYPTTTTAGGTKKRKLAIRKIQKKKRSDSRTNTPSPTDSSGAGALPSGTSGAQTKTTNRPTTQEGEEGGNGIVRFRIYSDNTRTTPFADPGLQGRMLYHDFLSGKESLTSTSSLDLLNLLYYTEPASSTYPTASSSSSSAAYQNPAASSSKTPISTFSGWEANNLSPFMNLPPPMPSIPPSLDNQPLIGIALTTDEPSPISATTILSDTKTNTIISSSPRHIHSPHIIPYQIPEDPNEDNTASNRASITSTNHNILSGKEEPQPFSRLGPTPMKDGASLPTILSRVASTASANTTRTWSWVGGDDKFTALDSGLSDGAGGGGVGEGREDREDGLGDDDSDDTDDDGGVDVELYWTADEGSDDSDDDDGDGGVEDDEVEEEGEEVRLRKRKEKGKAKAGVSV